MWNKQDLCTHTFLCFKYILIIYNLYFYMTA